MHPEYASMRNGEHHDGVRAQHPRHAHVRPHAAASLHRKGMVLFLQTERHDFRGSSVPAQGARIVLPGTTDVNGSYKETTRKPRLQISDNRV